MKLKLITTFFVFNVVLLFGQLQMQKYIYKEIDSLLIKGDYSYKILSISISIDNIYVVALDPPYREFPNIIIFKYQNSENEVARIYEALSLGVQDEKSKLLDLHTIGYAIDFSHEEGSVVFLDEKSEEIRKYIEGKGGTIILYDNFYHGHYGQRNNNHYIIDKTQYKIFAIELIGDIYEDYPDNKCIMYDTPEIINVQFSKINDIYLIEAITSNNQKWQVSFTGIDSNNKYLINKSIVVKNIK